MNKDQCFELGAITKLHGVKGQVQAYLDTDLPQNYTNLESVYVEINNLLTPFFIKKVSIKGGKTIAVITFEGVDTIELATLIIGKKLFLPLQFLPKLSGTAFYYHEMPGFIIECTINGKIGEIIEVVEHSVNPLFLVNFKETEVLIPAREPILNSINREEKKVIVTLPEGLLDVYLTN